MKGKEAADRDRQSSGGARCPGITSVLSPESDRGVGLGGVARGTAWYRQLANKQTKFRTWI